MFDVKDVTGLILESLGAASMAGEEGLRKAAC